MHLSCTRRAQATRRRVRRGLERLHRLQATHSLESRCCLASAKAFLAGDRHGAATDADVTEHKPDDVRSRPTIPGRTRERCLLAALPDPGHPARPCSFRPHPRWRRWQRWLPPAAQAHACRAVAAGSPHDWAPRLHPVMHQRLQSSAHRHCAVARQPTAPLLTPEQPQVPRPPSTAAAACAAPGRRPRATQPRMGIRLRVLHGLTPRDASP